MGFGDGGSRRRPRETMERLAPARQKRYTFGTHSQTCHVWAQQNVETHSGQSADGRIRFEGPTVYSYGMHFPMAHFVGEYDGRRVVLVTGASYSVTTSGHMSDMRGALQSADIKVPIADLHKFLEYPAASKAKLKEAHADLLDNVAQAQLAWQEADYGAQQLAYYISDRMRLDAFRAIYRLRLAIPADLVARYKEKQAKAKAKAQAEKLAAAFHNARRKMYLENVTFDPAKDYRQWDVEAILQKIDSAITQFRSARQAIAKAKRSRQLIRTCSIKIATLQELRKPWQDALAKALREERHEKELRDLVRLRDYINSGATDHERNQTIGRHAILNCGVEHEAYYWAVAIREGFDDVAAYLAARVQVEQWQSEVPDTFKPKTRDGITLEQWLAGKGQAHQYFPFPSTYVRRRGDTLETSQGASCPFSHAVLAYRAAARCRATGQAWQRNGHSIRVGHFSVDRIDPDGTLHAGCHTIAFDEMQRLAARELPQGDVVACFPLPAPLDYSRGK